MSQQYKDMATEALRSVFAGNSLVPWGSRAYQNLNNEIEKAADEIATILAGGLTKKNVDAAIKTGQGFFAQLGSQKGRDKEFKKLFEPMVSSVIELATVAKENAKPKKKRLTKAKQQSILKPEVSNE